MRKKYAVAYEISRIYYEYLEAESEEEALQEFRDSFGAEPIWAEVVEE